MDWVDRCIEWAGWLKGKDLPPNDVISQFSSMTNSGLCAAVAPTKQLSVTQKQLYVAWVPFQRRAVAMEADFGYALHHIGVNFRHGFLRGLEYLIKSWQTLKLLFQHRPQVLWIQMPPAPLLYLAFAYRWLFQQDLKIIADCHNATFRRPWIQFPGVIALFNHCQVVMVHNPFVEEQAIALGIRPEVLTVLRDRTLTLPSQASAQMIQANPAIPTQRPWVLVPCSFNADEPIAAILEAARLAPEITFVLSGNTNRAKGRHCLDSVPSNVKLAGFVAEETFNAMLAQADAIVGLTKLDGIQLSVANEALSYGQPMVLSHTKLLKAFFPKGAVYVDPMAAESIAQGCRTAIRERKQLQQAVKALKQDVDLDWQQQAEPIFRLLAQ